MGGPFSGKLLDQARDPLVESIRPVLESADAGERGGTVGGIEVDDSIGATDQVVVARIDVAELGFVRSALNEIGQLCVVAAHRGAGGVKLGAYLGRAPAGAAVADSDREPCLSPDLVLQ